MDALADEDFNAAITGELRRRQIVRLITVQEARLRSVPDAKVLEWAAEQGFVVLSHDWKTMRPAAWQRVADGLPMPGLVIVTWGTDPGVAIDHLEVLFGAGDAKDFENMVHRIP
ncbi:MAG: DUF5615 family PIN-like protein [Dehalococcoidia bacterium]|nr:DUF5615 family PIN-like protein [Dehalococcoidia bacterium]